MLRPREEVTSKRCAVEGCGIANRLVKGFCGAHYMRWRRHGDPRGGGTPTGEPQQFYLDVVIHNDGEECLIWPYAKGGRGYGQMYVDGKKVYVHVLACREVHGVAPSSKHEVAHLCGAGHLGCVNPRHLEWKTRSENHQDKLLHGTHLRGDKHPSAKLTAYDVSKIRNMKGAISQQNIAKIFSISQSHVGRIHRGERWY